MPNAEYYITPLQGFARASRPSKSTLRHHAAGSYPQTTSPELGQLWSAKNDTGAKREISLVVGHKRIGRLMRGNCFLIVRIGKYKVTTDSNRHFKIAPNWLDQDFRAKSARPDVGGQYNLYMDRRELVVLDCND